MKTASKTASPASDAWKKYSFADFTDTKPEKPVEKPTEKPKTEPRSNSKPEPKAEAKPTPVSEPETKVVAKPETTAIQAKNNSPAPLKAKQAIKMYGENSKCGLGYFQTLIDERL
ncbi:hypothetical protein D3C72_1389270 [compost metagenome]